MKFTGHCKNCNYRFEYAVNNNSDLENIVCPKCRTRFNSKNDNQNYYNNKFEDKFSDFMIKLLLAVSAS